MIANIRDEKYSRKYFSEHSILDVEKTRVSDVERYARVFPFIPPGKIFITVKKLLWNH